MGGGESVPAAVGEPGGPAEVDAGRAVGAPGCRAAGRGGLGAGGLVVGDEPLSLLQDVGGEPYDSGGRGDQVDAGADLAGERLHACRVLG